MKKSLRTLLLVSFLNLLSMTAFAGSFVNIDGEKFCAGENKLAYRYDIDWKEGGWGPRNLNIKGLYVYSFQTGTYQYYNYVNESPAPRYGLVFEASNQTNSLSKYIYISYDSSGGYVGFSNQFVSGEPVDPQVDNVYYSLSATYQPWIHCL